LELVTSVQDRRRAQSHTPVQLSSDPQYKKWQAEADKMGGGKITVDRSDAKKAIFDVLHDSFKPMNVNGLYQVSSAEIST